MEQARQTISELELQLHEVEAALDKARKPPPDVIVDSATPTKSPAQRKKHKSKDKGEGGRKEEALTRSVFSPTRSVSPDLLQRSASTNDVREGERARGQGVNRSLDSPTHPPHDRLTITELVADNLKKPGSMTVIRRELKADGLTPKIMKKFPPKTTPTALPAVPTETSPLAKTSRRSSKPSLSRSPASGNDKL